MSNSLALIKPEASVEEFISLNAMLKESYTQAKKQIQEGVTAFKEEFIDIYDKAGSYLNRITLPINNFLKDLSQIDEEFKIESFKESLQPSMSVASMSTVHLEHTLHICGEENY